MIPTFKNKHCHHGIVTQFHIRIRERRVVRYWKALTRKRVGEKLSRNRRAERRRAAGGGGRHYRAVTSARAARHAATDTRRATPQPGPPPRASRGPLADADAPPSTRLSYNNVSLDATQLSLIASLSLNRALSFQ